MVLTIASTVAPLEAGRAIGVENARALRPWVGLLEGGAWLFYTFIGSGGAGFTCSRGREEARMRELAADLRNFVSH